jgi:hypothetical protein
VGGFDFGAVLALDMTFISDDSGRYFHWGYTDVIPGTFWGVIADDGLTIDLLEFWTYKDGDSLALSNRPGTVYLALVWGWTYWPDGPQMQAYKVTVFADSRLRLVGGFFVPCTHRIVYSPKTIFLYGMSDSRSWPRMAIKSFF